MKGRRIRARRQHLAARLFPRSPASQEIFMCHNHVQMVAIRRLGIAFMFLFSLAHGAETPLHEAVEKGDRKLVERLLKEGADVNARTTSGETPLHYAAFPRDEWFVRELVSAGGDPRATN